MLFAITSRRDTEPMPGIGGELDDSLAAAVGIKGGDTPSIFDCWGLLRDGMLADPPDIPAELPKAFLLMLSPLRDRNPTAADDGDMEGKPGPLIGLKDGTFKCNSSTTSFCSLPLRPVLPTDAVSGVSDLEARPPGRVRECFRYLLHHTRVYVTPLAK